MADAGLNVNHGRLVQFMFMSLAASLTTMALKATAAAVTGSIGLLSDALESGVNIVAAVVGIVALRAAAKPPDREHQFGHGKAEYLSAGLEGGMVFTAAAIIVWTSINRLVHLEPIDQAPLGLALSAVAALVNLGVGLTLVRVGREHRSMTLEADGRHLLTDVWTSAGVLVGVAAVALFDLPVLDPLIALFVGVNILATGYQLLRRSVVGLLDAALPTQDAERIMSVLRRHCAEDRVEFAAVRTRESGRQRFIHLTMFVPGDWSVRRSHDLADVIEGEIAHELPGAITFTHVEPIERATGRSICVADPRPTADQELGE
ncbi:MAG: cation transporter [Microthrixaceae bacterium]|nr:cation transporter [Microthrixaceae bacterium]